MVDLALRMILDDRPRFAITVLGVGFAVALVLIQVGLFFGLLENASITIDRLDADLWVTARNTPNVDFANPFPDHYVNRVRSIPGVERADNLIVWYAIVALPSGAKEQVVYYGLEDFPKWGFPWDVVSGDPADLRRGRFALLDESAAKRFGPFEPGDRREFSGLRLEILGKTRGARSFTTSPIAFLSYDLAQALAPEELGGRTTFIVAKLAPGADAGAVADEIRRRLPYNDVYTREAWAATSRSYWIESTGLGLTMALTVGLGGLVGVVIVAQTLYASVAEHLPEFGTVKALGGRDGDVYGIIAEQAAFAAALGYGLGVAITNLLAPVLASFDMPLIVSPTLYALTFAGTLGFCLAAATMSFRKVARIDPAIVFRG